MKTSIKWKSAGNFQKNTRGDCMVQIELMESGGIQIELNSKVKSLFKNTITQLVLEMMNYYKIYHAKIQLFDTGALQYVLAARIEAAIHLAMDTDQEFLLPFSSDSKPNRRDRYRFSRLYLPGNTPHMMINAGIHQPNGIILDLEDAVAPDKKHEARYLVRNALRSQNFYGAEKMVRINQGDLGIEDLKFCVPHGVQLILVPKVETAEQLLRVDREIQSLQKDFSIQEDIYLMPIIESALGVENAFSIASATKNTVAMAIGLEDFTADLGVQRTYEAHESLYARTRIVNACHAAKIQPIDSVFSDISDQEALANTVRKSKALGFLGMGCIHPLQIKVIHNNFAPNESEITKAQKIVNAFYLAKEKGLGVVALGTKMIDAPVVKRNQKVLDLAINLGKIANNWRDSYEG